MANALGSEQHDELLKLLRGINEKLAREAEARAAPIPTSQEPIWKWYEHVVSPETLKAQRSQAQDSASGGQPRTRRGLAATAALRHSQILLYSSDDGTHDVGRSATDEPSKVLSTWKNTYRAADMNSYPRTRRWLEEYMGVAFTIPYDCRVNLPFALTNYGLYDSEHTTSEEMQRMRSFQHGLSGTDVDISIVDYNPWGRNVVYQLHLPCEKDADRHQRWLEFQNKNYESEIDEFWAPFESTNTLTRSTMQRVTSDRLSPWRRLIHFDGLANSNELPIYEGKYYCPYIALNSDRRVFDFHIRCRMIPGTTANNPYASAHCFNVTFFEILDSKTQAESQWKTGPLFTEGMPSNHFIDGDSLRYSAFTVCTQFPMPKSDKYSMEDALEPFFTILLLSPGTFHFDKLHCLFEMTAIGGEVRCIVSGLSNVVEKWTQLNVYFGALLADDFLDLKEYVKLLFDDENFTRSRKYFWAIGCLTEFINVLSDNIKQWDLYYEARIQPLLDLENFEEEFDASSLYPPYGNQRELGFQAFKKLIREGRDHREVLVTLREEFKRKLESANALRDGLFNASALVESRASTRLGENVKLLTYVSIFYLPLAFCAAVWAIPDIQSSSTNIPFVIVAIVVGIVTYTVVFNMDYMNKKLNSIYYPRRQHLVNKMRKESGYWKEKGNRFERFRPIADNQVPTEWWILLYLLRTIFSRIFGKKRRGITTDEPQLPSTNKVASNIDQTGMSQADDQQQNDNHANLNGGDQSSVKQPGKVASRNIGLLKRPSLRAGIFGRLPRGQGDHDDAIA